MKFWLKTAALACVFSAGGSGIAWSENMTREAATEKCWAEAHKEYPKDSGSDINTSALAKGAYFQYAACMEKLGLRP
ncbi:hypothetical protein SAMN05444581_11725 [Methylocapsa palsarum]|uniref:HdeA/HdeB family protein n=2 Tax=Methylocapsa palsarum TaxID=1612308 RepID=A0A1I4BXF4_9HYPH|nr:hypothetical protein SAMN05444581_11725 [Methylocapsa palsarum]